MFGLRRRKSAHPQPAVTLPVWPGPDLAPCCWVNPSQEHNLSCEHVSPELSRAYLGISEPAEREQ